MAECELCGFSEGRCRRVQVTPWRMQCLQICNACMPELSEAIQALRDHLDKKSKLAYDPGTPGGDS